MKAVRISRNKWNYFKDNGTYLLDKHVYYCFNFNEGFGKVQYKDYNYNFVNSEGKRLLKTNVNNCWSFNRGFSKIEINDTVYYIDKKCNFYNSDKVSFKKLYYEYPNMRSGLIEIISKYTYHDIEEYFVYKETKFIVIAKIKDIIKKIII